MDRKAFIKNTFGAIIGYALLPKCLTPAKEVNSLVLKSGQVGTTFKIKLDKRWFNQGDLLQTTEGQAILLEKTDNGFKGKFIENGIGAQPACNQYEFIEIEHEENPSVAFIADLHRKTVDIYNDLEPNNKYTFHRLAPEPFLKVQKICNLFIEEIETF